MTFGQDDRATYTPPDFRGNSLASQIHDLMETFNGRKFSMRNLIDYYEGSYPATTVMRTVQRLLDKGYIERCDHDRPPTYLVTQRKYL